MIIFFKPSLAILFLLICCGSLFSQDITSTKKIAVLIAIEDSLRGKLIIENDSAWLNEQLVFQNSVLNSPTIYYKLVKIGNRKFTEGPHANFPYNKPNPYNFKYGDSTYSILGKKVYTYIGNSSWGYYYEYHLQRMYPSPLLDFKPREPNTCEHGWDMRRGQACYQCLHQYKMKNDSNYKKNAYYNKLHEIKSTRFCKHNFDGHRGEGCPKCRDEDKIQNDSNYRINDSINGL